MYRLALLAAILLVQGPAPQTSGVISGRIINEDGTAAAGVRVSVTQEDSNPQGYLLSNLAVTDSVGRYRMDGVRPGRYLVLAGRIEAPTYYPGDLDYERAMLVTVAAGKIAEDIDFQVASISIGFKVRGRVIGLDAITETARPGTVSLGPEFSGFPVTTTVDAGGAFEFTKVLPGLYRVRVSSATPGAMTATVQLNVVDRDTDSVEIIVRREKRIAGTVVVEGGGPLPRFKISAQGVPAPAVSLLDPIALQSNGNFSMTTVEGRQWFELLDLPAGYRVKSFMYGTQDVTAGWLTIATTDTAELRLVLSSADGRRFKVRGRVTGLEYLEANEKPVRVTLINPQFVDASTVFAGKDGAFEFPGVLPGSYAMRLSDVKAPYSRPPLGLSVRDRNVDSVEIAIAARVTIQGRIVVQGSAPIPRFRARWNPPGGLFLELKLSLARNGEFPTLGPGDITNPIEINPAPDGTFKMSVFEGEYDAKILLPAGYTAEAVTYGATNISLVNEPGLLVNEQKLKITRNDHAEFRVRVTADTGKPVKVSGRLEGLDRAAFEPSAATVSLATSRYAETLKTRVRTDGTFEFPRVFTGAYALRLTAPGISADSCAPVIVTGDNNRDVVFTIPAPGVRQDKLQIGSAIFGSEKGWADVTPVVRKMVKPELNEIYAAPAWLKEDPAAGTDEQLTVSYIYQCVGHTFTTAEGGAVSYQNLVGHADPSQRPQPTGAKTFDIVSAHYGSGRVYTDVTLRVRELIDLLREDFARTIVNDAVLNVSTSDTGRLIITYVAGGRRATFVANNGQRLGGSEFVRNAWLPDDDKISMIPDWLATVQP